MWLSSIDFKFIYQLLQGATISIPIEPQLLQNGFQIGDLDVVIDRLQQLVNLSWSKYFS